MANLRPIELELIDKLTGMRSGYVLDFTNRTFHDFFRDEVGVDIDDDTYAEMGNSKGKRLRTFLQKAQSKAVSRALTALWEYREIQRLDAGQPETIRNCHSRLSVIVERLGGNPLAKHDATTSEPTLGTETHTVRRPSRDERQVLRDEFQAMYVMEPHPRGYAFETFLQKFFDVWGLQSHGGFRNSGEQIDGSFDLDSQIYLLEAKWHSEPTSASTLHAFQGKLSERASWTRGLFVSYEGFTKASFDAFTSRRVILMDGLDILDTIQRDLHLDEVLRSKLRHFVERKEPFGATRALFP